MVHLIMLRIGYSVLSAITEGDQNTVVGYYSGIQSRQESEMSD